MLVEDRLTSAKMTQQKSHRRPKIPVESKWPGGQRDAVLARNAIKMSATAASAHDTPRSRGPLPPYAGEAACVDIVPVAEARGSSVAWTAGCSASKALKT